MKNPRVHVPRKRDEPRTFPPGVHFKPSDEELMVEYLIKKLQKEPLPYDFLQEVHLNKYSPDELIATHQIWGHGGWWYFFTERERKYPKGTRPCRTIQGTSYGWRATGSDVIITSSTNAGEKLGRRKTLVYHNGAKTDWIMYEYVYEPSKDDSHVSEKEFNKYVLCSIHKKPSSGKNKADLKRMDSDGSDVSQIENKSPDLPIVPYVPPQQVSDNLPESDTLVHNVTDQAQAAGEPGMLDYGNEYGNLGYCNLVEADIGSMKNCCNAIVSATKTEGQRQSDAVVNQATDQAQAAWEPGMLDYGNEYGNLGCNAVLDYAGYGNLVEADIGSVQNGCNSILSATPTEGDDQSDALVHHVTEQAPAAREPGMHDYGSGYGNLGCNAVVDYAGYGNLLEAGIGSMQNGCNAIGSATQTEGRRQSDVLVHHETDQAQALDCCNEYGNLGCNAVRDYAGYRNLVEADIGSMQNGCNAIVRAEGDHQSDALVHHATEQAPAAGKPGMLDRGSEYGNLGCNAVSGYPGFGNSLEADIGIVQNNAIADAVLTEGDHQFGLDPLVNFDVDDFIDYSNFSFDFNFDYNLDRLFNDD